MAAITLTQAEVFSVLPLFNALSGSRRQQKKVIESASANELRTVLKCLAFVYFKQVEINETFKRVWTASKKKRTVKKYLGSKTKLAGLSGYGYDKLKPIVSALLPLIVALPDLLFI